MGLSPHYTLEDICPQFRSLNLAFRGLLTNDTFFFQFLFRFHPNHLGFWIGMKREFVTQSKLVDLGLVAVPMTPDQWVRHAKQIEVSLPSMFIKFVWDERVPGPPLRKFRFDRKCN